MAKRKTVRVGKAAQAKASTQDRHQGGYMVRLPEYYREFFRVLAKENTRTAVAEIAMCIEEGIRGRGLRSPKPAEK